MLLATLLWASGAIGSSFPAQSYKTVPFEVPDLAITRSNQSTEEGYLFFAETLGSTSPLIMTDTNELVWRGPTHVNAQNFRTQTLNNQSVLSYWSAHGYTHPFAFSHGTGFVIIMDNKYDVAYNICISNDKLTWVTPDPSTFPGNLKRPCYLDKHESFITNRGTIIATAYNVTRFDLRPLGGQKDGWIFDALFFEIDIATQNILFRWSAVENIDITTSNYRNQNNDSEPLFFNGVHYGSSQRTAWDFFHINSVQPVSGGYIVNSRMTWAFYKIDSKSGNVIWTLEGSRGGDFTLEKGVFWSWQHMARMHALNSNSFRISLFNNDNIRGLVAGKNTSSGYLLKVDTEKMHVTSLKNLRDPKQPIFSLAEGSYQTLENGHALLGYGAEPFIKEFNTDGQVIYTAQFAAKGGFVKAGPHSYRAYRNVWHGYPSQKPLTVASFPQGQSAENATQVDVWMSWNGATDYDGWAIYSGQTRTTLEKTATVNKNGFETKHTYMMSTQGLKYIMAEATQGGTALANSTVVQIKTS